MSQLLHRIKTKPCHLLLLLVYYGPGPICRRNELAYTLGLQHVASTAAVICCFLTAVANVFEVLTFNEGLMTMTFVGPYNVTAVSSCRFHFQLQQKLPSGVGSVVE